MQVVGRLAPLVFPVYRDASPLLDLVLELELHEVLLHSQLPVPILSLILVATLLLHLLVLLFLDLLQQDSELGTQGGDSWGLDGVVVVE